MVCLIVVMQHIIDDEDDDDNDLTDADENDANE